MPIYRRFPQYMMNLSRIGATLALTILLTSCGGYTVGNVKPEAFAGVKKLAVPTLKNSTLEPRLSVLVTNAIIKQLQVDGTYQLVDSSEADAVLEAEIDQIRRSQFRAARDNQLVTRELLSTMRVRYSVRDNTTGVILGSGISVARSNIVLDPNFQISDRQVQADVASRIAQDITSKISEGW